MRSGVPTPRLGSRALFPTLEARAYLGHAAIAPLSLAAQAHVRAAMEDVGRLGAGAFLLWEGARRRLVRRLEGLLGARAGTIALTAGTSSGLTALALSLPLEEGAEVVGFEGEFPANVIPYAQAVERFGGRLRLLPAPRLEDEAPEEAIVEGVERRLAAGARFVAVSAVQFQTGYRMPLRKLGELCERFDAWLLVDAIQAVGALPLDSRIPRLGALACGAHKWLLGAEGAGFLFVDPELRKRLRPLTAGWLSLEDGEKFLFFGAGHLDYARPLKGDASVFEGGSASLLGHAALEAGVEIIESLGPEAIFAHTQRYHDELELALEARGLFARGFRSLRGRSPEERSGIYSLSVPEEVALPALASGLRRRGIFPSTPDGFLRFAPHFSNSLDEAPAVAEALFEATMETTSASR